MSVVEVDTPDAEILVQNEGLEHDQAAHDQPLIEVKVYKKRWYVLFLFSLLGIYQGMVWNTFGPISDAVLSVFCPDWGPSTLATLGNWGNVMYIIPIIPMMWYFEKKGLRAGMLVTGAMMTVGTLLRCLPFKLTAWTWMCHLCAILNGIAGIVIFSAPSAVSAAWFPPSERTTATGIAIVFNNLGNAVSFFLGPSIVPDPTGNMTDTFREAQQFMGDLELEDDPCKRLSNETKHHIEKRIDILMYTDFALVATCFLAILIYFPSKPKIPPSLTSSFERMEFVPGIKKILWNKNAVLMTISFSFFNGLIASWYSVMNITFNHLPLGENKDQISGFIGLLAICFNSAGTIFVSRIVDHLKGKMKKTLLVLMTSALFFWIWMCLLCLEVIPFSLWQLYVSTIAASALTYSTGPIFFEFTVELVYPAPEGLVGAFLTCFYNSVGMIFLFLFYIPAIASNTVWIPYAIMFSTIISVPLLCLVKEEYNRSVIDQFQEPRSTIADHASYPEIQ